MWNQGKAKPGGPGEENEEETATFSEHKEYQWSANYLQVRSKAAWKVCVPGGALTKEILEQFPDHLPAGHPGIDGTRLAVRSLFWWPRMKADIEEFRNRVFNVREAEIRT